MVERLVANEKVEGSTPFARSIFIVIKSKFITNFFQSFINNKDIRQFREKKSFYLLFRLIRNFLHNDIIVQIYNFKIFASNNNNKASHHLLKKCEFGDLHELNLIKKISNLENVLLIDCGCNYGFYSFYAASVSKNNVIISVEASKVTSSEFSKNLKLNNFRNISFYNKAISNHSDELIQLNESEKDWESSLTHKKFKVKTVNKIQTITIDKLLNDYQLDKYKMIIKLDIEGNEMNAIEGALKTIKNFSPLIIIEISKYIFNHDYNRNYLENFLLEFDYSIYDTNNKKIDLENLFFKLNNLDKDHETIGNYYLIKNSSNILKLFLKNE